jgi:hypothetical protein
MSGSSPGPLTAFHRLAFGGTLWSLVRGIPKSACNVRPRPDSGLRIAEAQRLPPSASLTAKRKRIALVAHDSQKEKLASRAPIDSAPMRAKVQAPVSAVKSLEPQSVADFQ